jgi:hypothetical protein
VAAHVVGRDLQDAAADRDGLLAAALIAIRDRDRPINLDRFLLPPGLAHRAGHRHPQPEILRLLFEPFLELP